MAGSRTSLPQPWDHAAMDAFLRPARAFAPASIGNVAAGFDLLGAALAPIDGSLLGDVVTAAPAERPAFTLSGPYAEGLAREDRPNLVLRVAEAFAARWGRPLPPLALHLEKRLPLASGLGSSASSIVATLAALQAALGDPLGLADLLALGAEAEGFYGGGPHADNIAPSLLGGLRLLTPGVGAGADAVALPWPEDLRFVVVHPSMALPTAASRGALPGAVPLGEAVGFAGNLAALVQALHTGDRELLARCLRDPLAEPHRAPLVPGFRAVQAAAKEAGTLGCSLSGSGPSVFAVAGADRAPAVRAAMTAAFAKAGLGADAWICTLDRRGARCLTEGPCAS